MGALGCYLIALLPLTVAVALFWATRRFLWWEALIMGIGGFVIAAIFHAEAVSGMCDDTETWSGTVVVAHYRPRWKEYYEEAIYRTEYYTENETQYYTDSKGNSQSRTVTVTKSREVFDHWESETRWHNDAWDCTDTLIGQSTIDQALYNDIVRQFGQLSPFPGSRTTSEHNSRMLEGDPSDYQTVNKNNAVYPVSTMKHWENKVKACPSVFSYPLVAESAGVFDYPSNSNHFQSDRLVGATGSLNILKWDQMNARLGPTKKINIIAVGFGPTGASQKGHLQEAKWIGGKKNDLVITFGGGSLAKPDWCYVFGWSESFFAKHQIEDVIMQTGAVDAAIPLIEKEVVANYTIKNWHKFDYLTVEIPTSCYWWELFAMFVVWGGWITFAMLNDMSQGHTDTLDRYRRSFCSD